MGMFSLSLSYFLAVVFLSNGILVLRIDGKLYFIHIVFNKEKCDYLI